MTNSSNGEGIFKELLETLQGNTFTPIEWEGYTPYNQLPPRKPLPVRTQVILEPKQLDRVGGRYVLQPGVVLTVSRKGDHLQLAENQDAPGELFAEAEFKFFSKTS